MAKTYSTGSGKYGLKIVHHDGDIEFAYSTTASDRDKVYNRMKPLVKSIDKLRKRK